MKRNDFQFDLPIRQSYVAILLLIYKRFKALIRGAWPILLVVFFKQDSNIKNYVFAGLVGLVILSIIFAIISYFRFFFSVKGDELVVQKGVFTKKFLNIPFDRIQTVNFEQNIVQQVFDVVGLKIDTAGSKGSEFEFEALDKPTAKALRELILEGKRQSEIDEKGEALPIQEEKLETILHLSLSDLFKVGVTQNHIRSFALILAFFATIYQNLSDVGLDPDEMTNYMPEVDMTNYKLMVLVLIPIVFLVSFLISIIVTGLRYFDLKLERGNRGFKITSGLFNRKEVAAMDNKIQMISWKNNPLKRMVGINDVQFRQASSIEVKSKKSINIPGCNQGHINNINEYYFEPDSFENQDNYIISRHFIYWRILYFGIVPATIMTALVYLSSEMGYLFFLIPFFWLAWIIITSYIRHYKRTYSINGKILTSGKGMFGNLYNVMKLYKVQNIKIHSSIYQRRRGLADLQVFTAAGFIRIPFIEEEKARALRDYLLYKVENDERSFM
jgi:putative membrane protein